MVNSKSLDNLRPFKKGRSGNPGGLPKGTPKISPALVQFLMMPPRIAPFYPCFPRLIGLKMPVNG